MKIKYFIAIALSVASGFALRAQETIREMELLTVNDQITTVITATEPVRFVDISTDRVAGDQPLSNTVRLKPKEGAEVNQDGDILAVVTIIIVSDKLNITMLLLNCVLGGLNDRGFPRTPSAEKTDSENPVLGCILYDLDKILGINACFQQVVC